MTQEELAERAGVTPKAISMLERGGRKRPYPHTVRSLADALGLSEGERAALLAAVPKRETFRAPLLAPSALPVPVPLPELSEGPHLSYAIQGFSFAAVTAVGAGVLLRRDRRVRWVVCRRVASPARRGGGARG